MRRPLTRAGELVANLGLLAAATLVASSLVEAACRLAARRLASRPRSEASWLHYDPALGWAKATGETIALHESEFHISYRLNSHGQRGPERSYDRPSGVRRVLLLGDSFAEGLGVEEEHGVRAALEAALAGAGCGPREVIGAGTSGYSTDQQYLYYTSEGRRYGADTVVLMFFSNDLQGNRDSRKKPFFDLEADRLVLRNSPVPAPSEGQERRQPDRPFDWSRRHKGSSALWLLGRATELSRPGLHLWLEDLGLVPAFREHAPTRDWLRVYGPDDDETERRWSVTSALLRALHEAVTADGARLLVFYVPASFEVDERDWERTRERWDLSGDGWDRDKVRQRVLRACGEHGIATFDPVAAFREATRRSQRTYFRRDPHWNAAGHALAARLLADTLDCR